MGTGAGSGGDELVGVAHAHDRVEAGMLRGLLEEAGIRSMARPDGIDGPTLGFGLLSPGGGAQRIMVRADQAEAAREVLAQALVEGEPDEEHAGGEYDWDDDLEARRTRRRWRRGPRDYNVIGAYARALFWSLLAMGLIAAVYFLLYELL